MSTTNKLAGLVLVIVALCAAVTYGGSPTTTTDRLYDAQVARVASGTVTLDISDGNFAAWNSAINIRPRGENALYDVFVILDLADASTGFAAVHTSETITFAPAHLVDSFNVDAERTTTAISGTNAAGSQVSIHIPVVPAGGCDIKVKLSAEAGDTTIPYVIAYRSGAAAVVTDLD